MVITNHIRKRFVKDYALPINLFSDPYFTQRLEMLEELYQAKTKWELFLKEIERFQSEQEYFEYYNATKDKVINHLKEKPEFEAFNKFDMNQYKVDNRGIGDNQVFKSTNDGRTLMSIDLRKANFQALHFFSKELVDNCTTYEEYIAQFTDCQHIIESKYIRQVIFGACNPKRQVTIEKYIMSRVFDFIFDRVKATSDIQSFMHDEIVLDITDYSDEELDQFVHGLDVFCRGTDIQVKVEVYLLRKVEDSDFFIQYFADGSLGFKCVTALFFLFLYKQLKGMPIIDDDLVFYHEGFLSKFLEIPTYKLPV